MEFHTPEEVERSTSKKEELALAQRTLRKVHRSQECNNSGGVEKRARWLLLHMSMSELLNNYAKFPVRNTH